MPRRGERVHMNRWLWQSATRSADLLCRPCVASRAVRKCTSRVAATRLSPRWFSGANWLREANLNGINSSTISCRST